MIKALAPRMRRGCSWVWLWVVLAGGIPATSSLAQDSGKGKAADGTSKSAAKAEAAKSEPAASRDEKKTAKVADGAKAAEADAAVPETPGVKSNGSVEVFKDPRAEAALKVFKTITGLRDVTGAQINEIKQMAAGVAGVDSEAVLKFVQAMAFRLSDRSYLNAVLNPAPRTIPSRAIQEASDNLIDVLSTARLASNTAFLDVYNQALVATLPKLLDNNLIARIQAMIVLGQTGSPAALPIFINQLKDPNQTVWVKLWSARGLTKIVDNGTRVDSAVSAQDAINSGKALADLLQKEEDLPWPAQMRVLEAMGSMRQAAVPATMQKLEMASTAMRFLADPAAKPEVRAAAALALGMMRVNPAVARYNFGLVAHEIGLLTADLGETINKSFSENPTRSNYLTGLLVTPVFQAFNGIDGARESGLLKATGSGPSQATVKQIADLTAAASKASIDLVRAIGSQIPTKKKDLSDRVGALRTYLDKNAPKDFHLVPGGQEFRPNGGPVAEAPVEKAKVAGAPGGL